EMSAMGGQKQTFAAQKVMSALPPKADMCGATSDVRFGPKADMAYCPKDRLLLFGVRDFYSAWTRRLRRCLSHRAGGTNGRAALSGQNRCPHVKSLDILGYPLSAVSFCARASLGVLPVQRLNAFVNAPTSWYPRSHAISEIAKSLSFKYCLARSALSSARIPTKVSPSAASRRASVRW